MQKYLEMKNCAGHVLRMLLFVATLTAGTFIVSAQAQDLPDSSLEFPKDTVSAGSIDSTNIVTISGSGDIPTAAGSTYKNDFGKYHLSLGLGFYQSISNDVKNWDYYSSSYSQSQGVIEYVSVRRTMTNIIDLALDARAWQSEAVVSGYYINKIHVDNIGLGVRLTDCRKGAFCPYIQANVYMQSKSIEYIPKDNYFWEQLVQKSNVAFGINGGFEFRLDDICSIPLDICLITGKSEDNINSSWQLVEKTVYSFAVSTGLSFNFGQTGQAIASDPGMQNGIPVSLDTTDRHQNADTSQVHADSITDMTVEPAPAEKTKEIKVPFYRRHVSFAPVGCFVGRGKAWLHVGEYTHLFDLNNGNSAFLNYRYSNTNKTDLIADIRMWRSLDYVGIHNNEYSITVTSLGFGMRKYPFTSDIRYAPYVQAIVNAQIEAWDYSHLSLWNGDNNTDVGFGAVFSVGTEIRLNRNYSFPVEAFYQFGKKAAAGGFYEGELQYNDHEKPRLSVLGIAAGISYNWKLSCKTSNSFRDSVLNDRYERHHANVGSMNLLYYSSDNRNYQDDIKENYKPVKLSYRYSLTSQLSIFLDYNQWESGQTVTSKTKAFGFGCRHDLPMGYNWLIPYVQGGLYRVTSNKELWTGTDSLGHDLGFAKKGIGVGLSGELGIDIKVNRFLSFPVSARYMVSTVKVESREHYEVASRYYDFHYYPAYCGDRNYEGYEDISFFEITAGICVHLGTVK